MLCDVQGRFTVWRVVRGEWCRWAETFRLKGRERRTASRARGSGWARETIWTTDSGDSFQALFPPPAPPCLPLYPFLPLLRGPLAPPSSPASPGWEAAWSRGSPSSAWSLAPLLRQRQRENKRISHWRDLLHKNRRPSENSLISNEHHFPQRCFDFGLNLNVDKLSEMLQQKRSCILSNSGIYLIIFRQNLRTNQTYDHNWHFVSCC